MRSDPRSQFWYAAIGGHFCSFLVSNIFCDPLFLLSICLPYCSHPSNTNQIISQWRIPWVLALLFVQRDEACTLWLRRCLCCRFTSMPLIFRIKRIVFYLSTQLTHTWAIIARESMTCFLHRGFWNILTCHGIDGELGYAASPNKVGWTQAYMGLLLLHLNFQ